MPKIKRFPYLMHGDLAKVATQLGVEHQHVKEVSSGRFNNHLIEITLAQLNEERKNQADIISQKAVKAIVQL